MDISENEPKKSFDDLVQKRKTCKLCNLCEDLTLSKSNGELYQLEKIVGDKFSTDFLGLWKPVHNSNQLNASVLIIGQDFSNVGYFENVNSLEEISIIESANLTNKNLIRYIDATGINNDEIYFTNAILCVKSGSMNAPIKSKWITNCSQNFLKPLIEEYLTDLKLIITLGKVPLNAMKKIFDFSPKGSFSSFPGSEYKLNINKREITLHPMFHTGGLGNVNAAKAKKNPFELWSKIKGEAL